MIAVTERAKEILKERLAREISDDSIGFRLHCNSTGVYRLILDWQKPGNQIVEHQGANVLLINREISNALDGATLDYCDDGNGEKILICE
jgi:Fe-S cluster assembly iron-binding protein IscA